ncbi:MAG: hypothetical protein O3A01_04020 [bacterium]|nr:hypothetical protein [bacterium]
MERLHSRAPGVLRTLNGANRLTQPASMGIQPKKPTTHFLGLLDKPQYSPEKLIRDQNTKIRYQPVELYMYIQQFPKHIDWNGNRISQSTLDQVDKHRESGSPSIQSMLSNTNQVMENPRFIFIFEKIARSGPFSGADNVFEQLPSLLEEIKTLPEEEQEQLLNFTFSQTGDLKTLQHLVNSCDSGKSDFCPREVPKFLNSIIQFFDAAPKLDIILEE